MTTRARTTPIAAAVWAFVAALLVPLIIAVGLLAVIGTVSLRAHRHIRTRPSRPQPAPFPEVVHIGTGATEVTLGGAA